MSKPLADVSLCFSKYFWSYRRYPDYWIIFMYLETSVFKKLSSPPSISVLQATGLYVIQAGEVVTPSPKQSHYGVHSTSDINI